MDNIILKNSSDIALMRESGRVLASVFSYLDPLIKVGISTMQINDLVEDFITNKLNARPASKGQYDFPFVLNTSVNDVVCHGMPSEAHLLKSGDIVNVDITLEKNGFISIYICYAKFEQIFPWRKRTLQRNHPFLLPWCKNWCAGSKRCR